MKLGKKALCVINSGILQLSIRNVEETNIVYYGITISSSLIKIKFGNII